MTSGLSIDDYYTLKFIKSVDIHPTGTEFVAIIGSYQDNEDESDDAFHKVEETHMWLYDHIDDLRKEELKRQLSYSGNESNPSWSPSGNKIVYSSKIEDKPQLFVMRMDGGQPLQLTDFEHGVASKVQWSEEGDTIFFVAKTDIKQADPKKPYWYKRNFYRLDAMGDVHRFLQDIYMMDLESNEVEQLTDDKMHHGIIRLSPDGSTILSLVMFAEDTIDAIFPRIHLTDIVTKKTIKLSDMQVTAAEWLDNTTIICVASHPDAEIGTKSDLYRVDVETGEFVNLTENDFYGVSGAFQSDMPTQEMKMPTLVIDQNKVYYNVQIGLNIHIRSYNLDEPNDIRSVVDNGANYLVDVKDGRIFYAHSHNNIPMDLYVQSTNTDTQMALTGLNDTFLETKDMPESIELNFEGSDGIAVEGLLIRPKQTTEPLPTLLNIHGGPHAAWGNIFQFEVQYLVNAGYAVLMINHRASTGYGDEFATAIKGDWGNLDYKDLMAGIDYAIEQGYSDADRLGCFGISGGGNLSCRIVGSTDRFKAAIPENPLTSWRSFYGVSDIGRWFAIKELGGLPWEIPEVYDQCSPITFAHKATTPTLMIQHDNDLRCPAEQTEQFYAVLRDVGCEVEMLRFPSTPHGGSVIGPLEVRETQNREILNWFDKYVK